MSYQGARAQAEDDEKRRVFAVSSVRLDAAGRVIDVLWEEINGKSNLDVGAPVIVPVADVIDAIHDDARVTAVFPARFGAQPGYAFEVIEVTDGRETIVLVGPPGTDSKGHVGLNDLARLDE